MRTIFQVQPNFLLWSILFLSTGVFAQSDLSYWGKNVALMDMRTRSISNTEYVREIAVFDFNKSSRLVETFGFREDAFADNGKDFDKKAGDGIYTSTKAYRHSEGVPFVAVGNTLSANNNKVVVGQNFLYTDQLGTLLGGNGSSLGLGGSIKIECDVKQCPCPGECTCYACEWGMSSWCLDVRNCKVTVEFTW
ncbi:MAG: hypothetical protein IT260_00965 [Saprospiraceae bacterium]|nr:hypothetical protein [Saprospiraceae bacterium]